MLLKVRFKRLPWRAGAIVVVLLLLLLGSLVTAGLPALAAQSAYPAAVLNDGPAAYYRLDELSGGRAADSSAGNHPASFSGGVSLGAPGALAGDPDSAVTFDGNTGLVRGSAPLQVGSDVSIEAWVKPASSAVDAPAVSLYSGAARMLYVKGNRFIGLADVSSAWPTYAVWSGAVDTTVWHHVVFTVQAGTSLKLYVDGQLSGSATVSARPAFSAPLVIGGSDASWLHKFAGRVDEVAVYPTALTAARVLAHYSIGAGLTSPYVANVMADGPLAYWRLDEASGTTAADLSGNKLTAVLNGRIAHGAAGALLSDPTDPTVYLDGSTTSVRSPGPINVGPDFSIEAWVKPSSKSVDAPVVSLYSSSGSRTLYLKAGRFIGMADESSSWPTYAVWSGSVDTTIWHHVVFAVKGGSNLMLYVDGQLAGSQPVATRPSFSGTAVIGWSDATWLNRFSGRIDEVALYPTALSAARVQAHALAGNPESAPNPPPATVAPVPAPPTPPPAPWPSPVPQTCTASIQALVNATPSNGTLTLPACVARETITINKPMTLNGQAGSEIRGSDIWSSWTQSDGYWLSSLAVPQLPLVVSDPNACAANGQCRRPEQVFVDGQPLLSLPNGSIPSAGQFALVSDTDRHVRLGTGPTGHTVEVTTRARWIVTAADGVTIDNIAMRHAGNSTTSGAVSNDNYSNWTLQNSQLAYAHSADVRIATGTHLRVIGNDIGEAGLVGIEGTGLKSGGLVQGNHVQYNRVAGFGREWGAGGVKLTASSGVVVDSNEIDHNDGVGLWCDGGCSGVTLSNNHLHHNYLQGLNFEVSNGASIHDNALWENGWGKPYWGWGAGIVISSSANAEVYKNTVAWNYAGISVIAQNRTDYPGLKAVGNFVHDNVIVKKSVAADMDAIPWNNLALAWLADSPLTQLLYDPASNSRGQNNHYYFDDNEGRAFRYTWNTRYVELADFNATPGGTGGSYMTQAEMTAALTAAGIPLAPDTP